MENYRSRTSTITKTDNTLNVMAVVFDHQCLACFRTLGKSVIKKASNPILKTETRILKKILSEHMSTQSENGLTIVNLMMRKYTRMNFSNASLFSLTAYQKLFCIINE